MHILANSYKIIGGILCSLLSVNLACADEGYSARLEGNWRYSNDRSILMTEFWVPLHQSEDAILYGDARLMGDNLDAREFNFGIGYREIVDNEHLGKSIIGLNAWYDRRISSYGSHFNQVTAGVEWLNEDIDLRANMYVPLNKQKTFTRENPQGTNGRFVGNQLVVNTDQLVVEEALSGLDFELGYKLPFMDSYTDSTRLYGGAYYFDGDAAEDVAGWRTRIASDVNSDIQLGARFQKDDVRGSQAYLEATLRFPLGAKQSFKRHGLKARLDESPERDIDVVSNQALLYDGYNVTVINAEAGAAQNIIHVDNTAGIGGDGSAENPYDSLAGANAVAGAGDIIYVHEGAGTSTNQASGITLDDAGQKLIGSGVDLTFSLAGLSASNGLDVSANEVLIEKTTAPVITSAASGVIVSADDVTVAGLSIENTVSNGILVNGVNNAVIANNQVINAQFHGIRAVGYSGSDNVLTIKKNYIENAGDGAGESGIFVAPPGGVELTAYILDNEIDNAFFRAIWLESVSTSSMTSYVRGNEVYNSSLGIVLNAQGTSTHTAEISNNYSHDNTGNGFHFGSSVAGSDAHMDYTVSDNRSEGNGGHGMFAVVGINASGEMAMSGNIISGNASRGVNIVNSSSDVLVVDLGGGVLGAVGGNSIYGNAGFEVFNSSGLSVSAENNWWGVATGLDGSEVSVGAGVDSDPYLTEAPK